MERSVLMLRSEQRKKLMHLAKIENVSVAEINRRAIDQYVHASQDEMRVIELLGSALIESNKRTEKALAKTEKALDSYLQYKRK
jgi:hypothetical protein